MLIHKYLSIVIIINVRMEQVQQITSNVTHMEHIFCPKGQTSNMTESIANGITKSPTSRSDIARLIIRKFDAVRSFFIRNTAVMTNKLPMMHHIEIRDVIITMNTVTPVL